MLDGLDIIFKNKMERELHKLLHGDGENKGLYEQILIFAGLGYFQSQQWHHPGL